MIALVTGASSGIGYATARIFAENHIDLILCGRRNSRLVALENEISGRVKTIKLVFDVTDRKHVFEKINSLPEEWKNIDIVLNNAGNAHGLDLAQDASLDDWEAMIDINVKGLMYVTKAVLPYMIRNKKGHIVNISSIAGKEAYLKGNAYCASKHAVDGFNNGLRQDLLGTGIKVSLVSPGAVNTEFSTVRFKGDKERADKVYEGFEPLLAEDIADLIYFIVSRPRHVNIADSIILPSAQASATNFYKQ
ncbi:MAG: SDR family NAD(P)-dependent oxidoreductase [Bacteroidales bacterium]|nr:SDR family NAD(P)-dependent oxidoreductase [Bacteroidales bacterium]MBN2818102.1 SDR family NAD(P)-dependent oxidoreductase [Bacteroidales bacterium]